FAVACALCLFLNSGAAARGAENVTERMPLKLNAYQPLGPEWSTNVTLYQLNLHNYTPEGTIAAAAAHLPRLRRLGVGVVWLMPIHPRGKIIPSPDTLKKYQGSPLPLRDPRPHDGNPYCPRDHRQIDPALGTFDDLKAFTGEAHRLGIRVILGWIPNHTSWDSPLIEQHPEFYMRGEEGQVLYHAPWQSLARLDYGNSRELWQWMLDARNLYVERCGIDGFREDVAGRTPLEHWEWLRPRLDPKRELLMLAEAHEAALLGPLDMTYDWEMPGVYFQIAAGKASPTRIDDLLLKQSKQGPAGARRLRYLFNHDQTGGHRRFHQVRSVVKRLYGAEDGPTVPTHREKYGEALPTLVALNFTLPGGTPLIFMGEEIGYYEAIPHNRVEGYRIPWDVPAERNLAIYYARLARLVREHPAISRGSFERIWSEAESVYAFVRATGDDRVVVLANLSAEPCHIATLEALREMATEVLSGTPAPATGEVELGPWECRIYVK
ncbi:MAG: alpha-amylase family glycosyl hydrolase, partial [Planctomycetota bacterium]